MKKVNAGFARKKYLEVSEFGSRNNLNFSSQLVIGNRIIALDGVKKFLLVAETGKNEDPFLINLNKVAAITVRKSYNSINQGELKDKGIEAFLSRIDLQFQLGDKEETIVLPFYDQEIDDKKDRRKLDKKCKELAMILLPITS